MSIEADFPTLTMPQMLRDNARRMPDRVALHQKDFGIWQPLTWSEYYTRARHFGQGLHALGLQPGGHVAILSENRIEWVIGQLGAGLVRAVTVGVYPTSPANEVAYVLGHSDSEIVICEDQEQTDKILERLDELPKLRRIIVIDPKVSRPQIAARLRGPMRSSPRYVNARLVQRAPSSPSAGVISSSSDASQRRAASRSPTSKSRNALRGSAP